MFSRRLIICLITLLVGGLSELPNPPAFAEDMNRPHYMGTGSCASSNCHGNAVPRTVVSVLQNEYVTWLKHDQHAQAWNILTASDAKRIAYQLGIAAPEKDPTCTACHVSQDARNLTTTDALLPTDGVTCESCHGPAERYLKSHAARGATHADNLKAGLYDLANLSSRAARCASCHFGSASAPLIHRIYGAGHPRLSF